MKKKIKILDCTLRDGGYYNNWNFDKNVIEDYFEKINNSNIDVIEIGFRFLKKNSFFGPFAYSNENFIKKLKISKKIDVAVMINASDVIELSKSMSHLNIIKKFFTAKKKSIIKYFRVATHFSEIKLIIPFLRLINKHGYKVIVNIMQCSNKKYSDFKFVTDTLNKLNFVKVLYFADSLGSMESEEIVRVSKYLKKKLAG